MLKPVVLVSAFILTSGTLALPARVNAQAVGGGGTAATDCWVTFDSHPPANSPASKPRHVKCADQNVTCGDADARLGYCEFQLQVSRNSTGFPSCTPTDLPDKGFHIPFSGPDNDDHPKHVAEFEILQNFHEGPLSSSMTDVASGFSPVTVPLKIAFTAKGPVFQTTTIQMHPTMCKAKLSTSNHFMCPTGVQKDVDTFNLTCTPPVDGTGAKISPCTGISSTFQQLQEHIFDRKCSSQATCHGSAGGAHNLCLKPDCGSGRSAHGDLVGVAPTNFAAMMDGLKRVDPGNVANSFLINKINGGVQLNSVAFGTGAYGFRMPYHNPNPAADRMRPKLSKAEIQLISDWVIAGAPSTGFVSNAKGACH